LKKAYKFSILYFLLFALILLLSSYMLFEKKIGFSIDSVLEYYLGNEKKFTVMYSWSGMLKVILPHIFAFGLFSMVVLHFLIFTNSKHFKRTKVLILILFISGAFELLSPFFIINGFEFFAAVKLVSFFLFELNLLYLFYLLFFSIVNE